jgi:D-3-phosphoglycerate dehydrogenase
MAGTLGFRESLEQRLPLFQADRTHIAQLIPYLKRHITPSIKRNKQFFTRNAEQIYIISGGFREYIEPVVAAFGIKPDHILANRFTFDTNGVITGFDKTVPVSQTGGKSIAVSQLKLNGTVVVIGDGYTDLEIKLSGAADKFFAFTENVYRPEVVSQADREIPNFDELLYRYKLPASVSYPKNRIKVLLLEKIDKTAVEYFEKEGFDVKTMNAALGEEELITALADVTVLGIRSKTKVTRKVLEQAPKLLTIGAFCIGTNQIDLEAAADHGVAVFNAPYSNTRSVVELALGEIMVLMRKVYQKSVQLHDGVWDKSADGAHEIRGKKLGIIGYGNIGSQLSVLAESLGMEVYFYDIVEKLALGNARKAASLAQLLKTCDVISIHVDGRKENTNLISTKEFAQMKNGVIVINSSRGHVVDVEALAGAVRAGRVRGAAVDVFPYEPKSNDERFQTPLQGLPNVILTPHIGGSTKEAQVNIAHFVSQRILQFVNLGDTTLSVNFPNLQLPALSAKSRFIHIHRNTTGRMALITNILAEEQINIEGQYLKTNETIGYVITDVGTSASKRVIEKLKAIPDTIRVRVLY